MSGTTIVTVDELRAVATSLPAEPWDQGRVLRTRQTASWSKQMWTAQEHIERAMVFSNFQTIDEGCSRRRIGQFESHAQANFVATFDPPTVIGLLDEIKYLRQRESDLVEALEFYADEANWIDTPPWGGDPECITPKAIPVNRSDDGGSPCDCGDRARAALEAQS